jgi:hypothetical protein
MRKWLFLAGHRPAATLCDTQVDVERVFGDGELRQPFAAGIASGVTSTSMTCPCWSTAR